jgi:hypothetical protein
VGSGLHVTAAGAQSPAANVPGRSQEMGEANATANVRHQVQHQNHHTSVGHTVVSIMYQEWYGQDRYQEIPIDGPFMGVLQRWRKSTSQNGGSTSCKGRRSTSIVFMY